MENKKYEFTGETKTLGGVTFRRIRALVTIIGVVNSGDCGGWIESEKNLQVYGNAWVSGNAWVYGNAQVYGDARVSGNAQVYGDALVSGNAQVYGDARVSGNAWVYGDALVSGNAQVYGDARVYGDAAICMFSGFGSEFRTTTAFIDKIIGVRVVCGCFTGTIEQFRERVIKTHGEDSKNRKLYLGMANMIEYRLEWCEVKK